MMKIFNQAQASLRRDRGSSDALYDLVKNSSAREKKKIISKTIRQANEEQRKIYYGTLATK
jgi:hypothetical protein